MGGADVVPGVSGGTVAFVLDFYKELIYSFQKINFKAFKLLITGRFKSFYTYINGEFMLLVMGGSMFSYFSISIFLDYLIRNYELYVWSAFFGMILGSIYYISKDFKDWSTFALHHKNIINGFKIQFVATNVNIFMKYLYIFNHFYFLIFIFIYIYER